MTLRRLTQTHLSPGNCVQTALACALDLPAEHLPDQVAIEHPAEGAPGSYLNAVNAYLERHHGLMYSTVYDYAFGGLRPIGFHLMIGPTVRTRPDGRNVHAVVGLNGHKVWDPHPSRAGLTYVSEWGILSPMIDRIAKHRAQGRTRGADALYDCVCPMCLRAVQAAADPA